METHHKFPPDLPYACIIPAPMFPECFCPFCPFGNFH